MDIVMFSDRTSPMSNGLPVKSESMNVFPSNELPALIVMRSLD
jgi:hypothetical protein